MLAIERREYILEKLRETGRIQVSEISKTLGVSRMTVHRDLDALANEGEIRKVFGGAVLARMPVKPQSEGRCNVCGRAILPHTRVILHTADGKQLETCCPHCAMLLMERRDDIISGLATDFLHGKMINLKTATFVVNPDVVVCCTPSVISFADTEEARRFQIGFHGELVILSEAQKLTAHHMHLSS